MKKETKKQKGNGKRNGEITIETLDFTSIWNINYIFILST
jgi:hypothetical protein